MKRVVDMAGMLVDKKVNVLNATELYIEEWLKWSTLCSVCFTTVKIYL